MDDIIDNFPGASSKNYQYLDKNDEKREPNLYLNSLSHYDMKSPRYSGRKTSDYLNSRLDDYDGMPRISGLKSIDDSYDHDRYIGGPQSFSNMNKYYQPTNNHFQQSHPIMVVNDTPNSLNRRFSLKQEMNDKFIIAPSNQMMASFKKQLPMGSKDFKDNPMNDMLGSSQQLQFLSEQEIQQIQLQQYNQFQKMAHQSRYNDHNLDILENQKSKQRQSFSKPPPQLGQSFSSMTGHNYLNNKGGVMQQQYPQQSRNSSFTVAPPMNFQMMSNLNAPNPGFIQIPLGGAPKPQQNLQGDGQAKVPSSSTHTQETNRLMIKDIGQFARLGNQQNIQFNLRENSMVSNSQKNTNLNFVPAPLLNLQTTLSQQVSSSMLAIPNNKSSEANSKQPPAAKISLSLNPAIANRQVNEPMNKTQASGSVHQTIHNEHEPPMQLPQNDRSQSLNVNNKAIVSIDLKNKLPKLVINNQPQAIPAKPVVNQVSQFQRIATNNIGVIGNSIESQNNHKAESHMQLSISNLNDHIDFGSENHLFSSNECDMSSILSESEIELSFKSNKAYLGKNKNQKKQNPPIVHTCFKENYDFKSNIMPLPSQQPKSVHKETSQKESPAKKEENTNFKEVDSDFTLQAKKIIRGNINNIKSFIKNETRSFELKKELIALKLEQDFSFHKKKAFLFGAKNKPSHSSEEEEHKDDFQLIKKLQEIVYIYKELNNMERQEPNTGKLQEIQMNLQKEMLRSMMKLSSNKSLPANLIDQRALYNLVMASNKWSDLRNHSPYAKLDNKKVELPTESSKTNNPKTQKSGDTSFNTSGRLNVNDKDFSDRLNSSSQNTSSYRQQQNGAHQPQPQKIVRERNISTIDQSNHQNVSIGKFIKQDVIFNCYMIQDEKDVSDIRQKAQQQTNHMNPGVHQNIFHHFVQPPAAANPKPTNTTSTNNLPPQTTCCNDPQLNAKSSKGGSLIFSNIGAESNSFQQKSKSKQEGDLSFDFSVKAQQDSSQCTVENKATLFNAVNDNYCSPPMNSNFNQSGQPQDINSLHNLNFYTNQAPAFPSHNVVNFLDDSSGMQDIHSQQPQFTTGFSPQSMQQKNESVIKEIIDFIKMLINQNPQLKMQLGANQNFQNDIRQFFNDPYNMQILQMFKPHTFNINSNVEMQSYIIQQMFGASTKANLMQQFRNQMNHQQPHQTQSPQHTQQSTCTFKIPTPQDQVVLNNSSNLQQQTPTVEENIEDLSNLAHKDDTDCQGMMYHPEELNADIVKQEKKEKIKSISKWMLAENNLDKNQFSAALLKDMVFASFQSNIFMLQTMYQRLNIDFTFGRGTPCNLQEQDIVAIQQLRIDERIDNKLMMDQAYMQQLRFGVNESDLLQVQKMLIQTYQIIEVMRLMKIDQPLNTQDANWQDAILKLDCLLEQVEFQPSIVDQEAPSANNQQQEAAIINQSQNNQQQQLQLQTINSNRINQSPSPQRDSQPQVNLQQPPSEHNEPNQQMEPPTQIRSKIKLRKQQKGNQLTGMTDSANQLNTLTPNLSKMNSRASGLSKRGMPSQSDIKEYKPIFKCQKVIRTDTKEYLNAIPSVNTQHSYAQFGATIPELKEETSVINTNSLVDQTSLRMSTKVIIPTFQQSQLQNQQSNLSKMLNMPQSIQSTNSKNNIIIKDGKISIMLKTINKNNEQQFKQPPVQTQSISNLFFQQRQNYEGIPKEMQFELGSDLVESVGQTDKAQYCISELDQYDKYHVPMKYDLENYDNNFFYQKREAIAKEEEEDEVEEKAGLDLQDQLQEPEEIQQQKLALLKDSKKLQRKGRHLRLNEHHRILDFLPDQKGRRKQIQDSPSVNNDSSPAQKQVAQRRQRTTKKRMSKADRKDKESKFKSTNGDEDDKTCKQAAEDSTVPRPTAEVVVKKKIPGRKPGRKPKNKTLEPVVQKETEDQDAKNLEHDPADEEEFINEEGKKTECSVNISLRGQHALVPIDFYPSFSGQQYQIYISFEVQILMHIHSYLSKNEVIGLLGGIQFETEQRVAGTREKIKILFVTKIYPAQSNIQIPAVRHKNCEISDEDQIRIQEQMEKDKVQKLAWYHSHPVFDVDPSVQDLQTHFTQQVNFDRQNLPFFGVILSPYSPKQAQDQTMVKVFHLRDDKGVSKSFSRTVKVNFQERAKAFHHRVVPLSKLKYQMYSVIKNMIKQGATHKWDKPDLLQEWAPSKKGRTKLNYLQKLVLSMKHISDQNLELLQKFDVNKEIRDRLVSADDKYLFDFHYNGLDCEDERQYLEQLGPHVDKKEMLNHLMAKHLQKSNLFFSISDQAKIQKFLLKIEQCLLKNFCFDQASYLEQVYREEREKKHKNESQSNSD